MFIVPRLRKDPIQALHLTTIIRFCAVNITDTVVVVVVAVATNSQFKVTMSMQLISSFCVLQTPMLQTPSLYTALVVCVRLT